MTEKRFSAAGVIERKRSGRSLSTDELDWFVESATRGRIPEYQLSALLMAIYFKGMSVRETRDLTRAMMHTGRMLDLSDISGVKVDKHSTGGVGDKISLIVGPLVAAVGVKVPMISGRALGHTGGTLDKLESIPGFRTDLSIREFKRVVDRVGISIIGQTEDLAPADRKFYAVRDVTATVASPPLMVSSILSKKIASGAEAVVFDVKCGSGAFMKRRKDAVGLAGLLGRVGRALGFRTAAVLTRMDEPLGRMVGNSLEVREAIEVLKGEGSGDLLEISLALGSEMVRLAGKAGGREEAVPLLRKALKEGRALEKLAEMIEAQGGERRVVDDPERLPRAAYRTGVKAPRGGYVASIDALETGRIAALLGGGRRKTDDRVDHAVGIEFLARRGDRVKKGDRLALIHTSGRGGGRRAGEHLLRAVEIISRKPRRLRPVIGVAGRSGIRRLPSLSGP
jgi:pyrimidine-nucleoside phosphorylase